MVPTNNIDLSKYIGKALYWNGVREICLVPGNRNGPLYVVLSENPRLFRVYYFNDERSAAFFALGRMRATRRKVAVVTTSGTAAGELLPAAMEATYAELPLILITADRPRHYRHSGAPQTANQIGIFGVYASACIDIEGKERPGLDRVLSKQNQKPVHLNVCFDEPFLPTNPEPGTYEIDVGVSLDGSVDVQKSPGADAVTTLEKQNQKRIAEFFQKIRNPLVIVGMLRDEDRDSVADFLSDFGVPTYVEATSGLREDSRLESFRINSPDRIIERAHQADYPVDAVIRIGGVPTPRFWRDLEGKFADIQVLSLSRLPFSGLGRQSICVTGDLAEILSETKRWFPSRAQGDSPKGIIEKDRDLHTGLLRLVEAEPRSEQGMVAGLSKQIPTGARIYLGNSLPIRDWDLCATREDSKFQIWASRGLNGIDGQVSTFLGYAAEKGRSTWALLGDLTTLYDLAAPWILPQLRDRDLNLVVINNQGGKIFERFFPQDYFQNSHTLGFRSWAELWGMSYETWREIPEKIGIRNEAQPKHSVMELLPDQDASRRFWKGYQALLMS